MVKKLLYFNKNTQGGNFMKKKSFLNVLAVSLCAVAVVQTPTYAITKAEAEASGKLPYSVDYQYQQDYLDGKDVPESALHYEKMVTKSQLEAEGKGPDSVNWRYQEDYLADKPIPESALIYKTNAAANNSLSSQASTNKVGIDNAKYTSMIKAYKGYIDKIAATKSENELNKLFEGGDNAPASQFIIKLINGASNEKEKQLAGDLSYGIIFMGKNRTAYFRTVAYEKNAQVRQASIDTYNRMTKELYTAGESGSLTDIENCLKSIIVTVQDFYELTQFYTY
jgi:hypothetical protein